MMLRLASLQAISCILTVMTRVKGVCATPSSQRLSTCQTIQAQHKPAQLAIPATAPRQTIQTAAAVRIVMLNGRAAAAVRSRIG
jgi:hypothetical protein